MYKSQTIMDCNLIFIFEFYFKHTLTSSSFFFLFVKNHIINLLYIVLIDIRFNVSMCFIIRTYFIIFIQDDIIHCMINHIVVLLLSVKKLLVAGSFPQSLVDLLLEYLEPKSPKTLHLSYEYPVPWIRQVYLDLYLR